MILADVSNGPTVMILALLTMVIPLWAVIDALARPAVAFYAAGSNKTAWVIVLLVATFVLGIGLFLAAYYLIAVRRKVRQQMQPR
jgi:uncharacterized membrane-anchored protein